MSSTPSTAAAPARPTPALERALAPDLARGVMLLFIALAHVPWFVYDAPLGAAMLHPAEGNLADRIVQVLTLTVVDARTHTMFGFLFAYAIGQMYARRTALGTSPGRTRRIMRHRHLWMLAFGAAHALLLWQGDILGVYGLIGLVMTPLFFGRSDRVLKIWVTVLLSLGAVFTLLTLLSSLVVEPSATAAAQPQRLAIAETDYLSSVVLRLGLWSFGLFSGLFTLALPTVFLLGLLAARHRILEEPSRHLTLLRWTAFAGIPVGWATGALLGLEHVGVLDMGHDAALAALHFHTGIPTGVGYAALFGLLVHHLRERGARGRLPVRALAALGRRSLSGYLAQSLVFVPLLAAWGLGLGAHLTSGSAAMIAVATWTATVVGAFLLERAGRSGPAEVLLRRATYGPAHSR
ncbi:DUF418 domain-containing protein [Nocardiopsis alba]|uniref:DUF418 domain-containing protein n=1 Tax=Nocardiopsis alba TaxID=53437 RepID=UPI00366CD743